MYRHRSRPPSESSLVPKHIVIHVLNSEGFGLPWARRPLRDETAPSPLAVQSHLASPYIRRMKLHLQIQEIFVPICREVTESRSHRAEIDLGFVPAAVGVPVWAASRNETFGAPCCHTKVESFLAEQHCASS